jgi:hypothetical protein
MPNGEHEYRKIWEMVRDMQKELERTKEWAIKLSKENDKKDEIIKSLQLTILTLNQR